MTFEIGFLFFLIIVAVILFVSEKVSFDVTALIITGILMVSGILTVEEGLSGFSNQATVTIGAMFVISAGFRESGALRALGSLLTRLYRKDSRRALLFILALVGIISAFINNTAAVAIFIPVFIGISAEIDKSPSKLLMPLSFVSIFGGACTLIGTSTNILIASIAVDNGLAEFSMFEFAPMGLIFLAVGFLYLFLYGNRMIPEYEQSTELTSQYDIGGHLYDLELTDECPHIGKSLKDCILTDDIDLDVLRVFRREGSDATESSEEELEKGDVLRLRGSSEEVRKVQDEGHLRLKPPRDWKDSDLVKGADVLVEVSISPESGLVGKNISSVDFKKSYGAIVLALRHRGKLIREDYGNTRLAGGDSLLLSIRHDRVPELERSADFIVTSQVELKSYSRKKIAIAVLVLAGVISTAAFDILPIVVSAILGALLLLVTGTVTTRQAYNAVQWKVIFLLAGILPLGIAMNKTGAAELLSEWLLSSLQQLGPTAVLSGFFLLAMVLTNIISNQASAVLLAPIMISAANSMSVNPRTFLFALAFASSLSFATPVGYQTNTMIYNAGRYRFSDFVRIGVPLSIILWLTGTLLIPVFWPL
jgi:di/tricarboxylate transporter